MYNLFVKSNKKRAKRRGFTLIELVIVVVILGILAGVAALTFSSSTGDAKKNVAIANLRAAKSACQLYVVDNGKLPEKATDIDKYVDGDLKKALAITAANVDKATANDTPTPGFWYEFKATGTGTGTDKGLELILYQGKTTEIKKMVVK